MTNAHQPHGRIVCFGEIMIRLSPPDNALLLQSPDLKVSVGGAEANVAVSLARFGRLVSMVTVLPDNALGHAVLGELRRHGVDVHGIVLTTGRLGLYFVTPGAGVRPSEVLYDRAHSAFADAGPGLIDWEGALAGASWLHISGVTPALGPRGAETALRAAQEAARIGVGISFDGNYRAKLWSLWDGDPAAILYSLLELASVAFVDDRDIALVLKRSFDDADPLLRRKKAADAAFAAFPKLERIASTIRQPGSTLEPSLAACLFTRRQQVHLPAIALGGIVDRIGSGDAFAAGVLHGLIAGWDDRKTLAFAQAAAALKHGIPGDFNLSTAPDVEDFIQHGRQDVRR